MTERSILVRHVGQDRWGAPEASEYSNEAHLQEVLATDPSQVPGVGPDSVAAREVRTSAGPVDVTIVSPDGELTVVECKLASNPDQRRMVLGQLIDYAAAIWSDGTEAFLHAWQRRGAPDLLDLLDTDGLDQLRSNISECQIDLCLAVDRIDDDLRRLIEYMNKATSSQIAVSAVQLAFARHDDVEILIPSTYGGEIASSKAKAGRRSTTSASPEKLEFIENLQESLDRPLKEQGWGRVEVEGSGPRIGVWPPSDSPARHHVALLATFPKADRTEVLFRFWGHESLDPATRAHIVDGFNERHGDRIRESLMDPDNVTFGKSAGTFGGEDTRVNRHTFRIGFEQGELGELAHQLIELAAAYSAAIRETETEFPRP